MRGELFTDAAGQTRVSGRGTGGVHVSRGGGGVEYTCLGEGDGWGTAAVAGLLTISNGAVRLTMTCQSVLVPG